MKVAWKHSALEKTARCWRDPFALLIAVLALLGTVHILVRTASYGAAVAWDSPYLLSTALNFLAGEGWRDFRGNPLVGWLPLFPLLLAASGWVGIDPLEAGRLLNAAAFGLTILAAGCWLRSNLRSQGLALAATAIITASLPLSDIASYFLTDAFFLLFILLALIQLAAFLNRGGRTPLLLGVVFTALAALTRYPGVVLIGVSVLLLVWRTRPLAARLKDAIVFGAVSSLPLAGVLTRNWAISGTLTGYRKESGQSLSDVLSRVADVCRAWVIPPNAPDGLGYLLWTATGLVVAAGAVVLGSGLGLGLGGKDRPASPLFGLGPIIPFGGFAVAYLLFIVAIVPLVIHSQIPARYLLPVYVPLLLAAVFLLDRFLSIKAVGWMGAAQYGLASLVLLGALAHIGYSTQQNLTITDKARVAGFESWTYNGSYWEFSETLNYIRDNHIDSQIYSNNPRLAWFWDRTAAPGKHQYIPDDLHLMTSAIMQESDDDTPYIAWLQSEGTFYAYDDFDIRLLPGVEPVAELGDGVVFRVTETEPFNAERHRARKQRYVQQLIERAGELVIRADSTWPIRTSGAEQADEQVARAGWDVYRTGRKLTYHKQPCAPDDVQTNFVLQVSPVDPADLSADRRSSGFDHLDFKFHTRGGVRLNDQCVVTAQLPYYPISRIYIGRWMAGNDRMLWEMKAEGI